MTTARPLALVHSSDDPRDHTSAVHTSGMAKRWRDMLADKDEELQKSNRRHYRRDKVRTKDVLSEYYAGEFN